MNGSGNFNSVVRVVTPWVEFIKRKKYQLKKKKITHFWTKMEKVSNFEGKCKREKSIALQDTEYEWGIVVNKLVSGDEVICKLRRWKYLKIYLFNYFSFLTGICVSKVRGGECQFLIRNFWFLDFTLSYRWYSLIKVIVKNVNGWFLDFMLKCPSWVM